MDKGKITDFSKKKITVKGKKLLNKEGFAYVTLDKDVNGIKFNLEHLKKYASSNKYTITVSKQQEGKTVLNNYIVENDEITKFFAHFIEGKIEGEIIEIDKFDPEILA